MEEILAYALEMRRRVKEQLKKIGGMEFYDVNFSNIDNETFDALCQCWSRAEENSFQRAWTIPEQSIPFPEPSPAW